MGCICGLLVLAWLFAISCVVPVCWIGVWFRFAFCFVCGIAFCAFDFALLFTACFAFYSGVVFCGFELLVL